MQRFFYFITVVLTLLFLSSCGNTRKTVSASKRPPSFHEQKRLRFEHEALEAEPLPVIENAEVEAKDLSRNRELYDFIDEWEGTPHRMGGNTKKGVDCSGFVINIYNEVYQNPFKGRRAEDLFSETTPIQRENLREGDLVFFKIHGRRIDHVGVYLSKGDFVHVSSSRGVMVSNLEEAYYQKRFFMGGRRNNS